MASQLVKVPNRACGQNSAETEKEAAGESEMKTRIKNAKRDRTA